MDKPESTPESATATLGVDKLGIGLPGIGAILSHYRKKKGLSLEECFDRLRIRVVYLEALEQENLEALPESETTVCAFLRSYADLLGLNGKDLAQRFSERHYTERPSVIARDQRPLPVLPTNMVMMAVIGLLLVLLALGIGRNYLSQDSEAEVVLPPPQQGTEDTSAVTHEGGIALRYPERVTIEYRVRDGLSHLAQTSSARPLEFSFGERVWIRVPNGEAVTVALLGADQTLVAELPVASLVDEDGWLEVDRLTEVLPESLSSEGPR